MTFSEFIKTLKACTEPTASIKSYMRTIAEILCGDNLDMSDEVLKSYYYGHGCAKTWPKKILRNFNAMAFREYLKRQNSGRDIYNAFKDEIANITPKNAERVITEYLLSMAGHEVKSSYSDYVDIDMTAEFLCVSVQTVRAWMKRYSLPYYKISKVYRFRLSDVEEWMKRYKH